MGESFDRLRKDARQAGEGRTGNLRVGFGSYIWVLNKLSRLLIWCSCAPIQFAGVIAQILEGECRNVECRGTKGATLTSCATAVFWNC